MMSDTLEVRRDGVVVARLSDRRGRLRCSYSDEIVASVPGGTPLLSCSLPVSGRPADATAWARGLLPEGQHLATLAAAADLAASDTFGMLRRYGRDIAGAFEIVAPRPVPREPSIELYGPGEFEAEVSSLDEAPLAIHDDSELSIAGLQDKLVVVATPEGWARPRNGYPSTHIVKLDSLRHRGLVRAEAACLRLAAAVGLTSLESSVIEVGGRDVLVVSRFDRVVSAEGSVTRTHQEDLLQALGIAPEEARGRSKYQRVGSPGPPSWWHAADLLDSYSGSVVDAFDQLLRLVVFTTVIGNADCHAKNVAFILGGNTVELAPIYDTVPTALWPQLRKTATMSVNDVVELDKITVADLLAEAVRWRHRSQRAAEVIDDILRRIDAHVDVVAHDAVSDLVVRNLKRLKAART